MQIDQSKHPARADAKLDYGKAALKGKQKKAARRVLELYRKAADSGRRRHMASLSLSMN